MVARSVVPIALLLLVAACAHGRHVPERDRNVIREDEIARVQVATAYDVVARLRAEFLKTRGPVTRTTVRASGQSAITVEQPKVTVFIDGVEAGPVEQTLSLIPATEVLEIHLYRASDAVTKYGSRHIGGVIAVSTRARERP